MAVPAGQFDQLIQLEQQVSVQNPNVGSYAVEWVPFGRELPARVLESSTAGSNPTAAEGMDGYARPTKIWIRWMPGIDKARMRINWGGRILQIDGSAELGRRERIEFACSEWAHENG